MSLIIKSQDKAIDVIEISYPDFHRLKLLAARTFGCDSFVFVNCAPIEELVHRVVPAEQVQTVLKMVSPQTEDDDEKLNAYLEELAFRGVAESRYQPLVFEVTHINKTVPGFHAFLSHSDCEGEFSVQECKDVVVLLARLKEQLTVESVKFVEERTKSPVHPAKESDATVSDAQKLQTWIERIESFRSGLGSCAAAKQKAVFLK
eukprot:ANDGO_04234.mRNA.1 hypothetical protein